jgi:antitoxin HigA-1
MPLSRFKIFEFLRPTGWKDYGAICRISTVSELISSTGSYSGSKAETVEMSGVLIITDKGESMLPLHRVSTHPGQILLKEFLKPLGLTQVRLAKEINIPINRVNELIRGKRGITPETALLLAEYFNNSAEFWMNLQTTYDLTRVRAEQRKQPVPASGGRPRSARRSASGASRL